MTLVFELNSIDRHFADFILKESGGASSALKIAVSLLSNSVGNGNICLNLADIAGRDIRIDGEEFSVPEFKNLHNALLETPVVGSPGDFRPLVLDTDGRLYLYRYWKYERDLAQVILQKAALSCDMIDKALFAQGLDRLFPGVAGKDADWQRVAALAALRKKICIISGGPGTGKTSTVVKILALLLEQANGESLRVALAAPTGKSAARLREAVSSMKDALDCADSVKALIPNEVSTIHRLLGPIAGSVHFRYSDENLLPYDVVIIDEASMIALPLMAKMAAALKPDAGLIILGDRDQLSSVEAGAVLGDMCGGGQQEIFSPEFGDLFAEVSGARIPTAPPGQVSPPLTDSLVILKKNYRFPDDSGIGAAGRAVNAGKSADALAILKGDAFPDIAWRNVPKPDGLKKAITNSVVEGYSAYLAAGTVAEALKYFNSFRVLCALNQGPYGVAGMNTLIEEILAAKGLIDPQQRWYRGRPVLITINDYNLKLFNGDVGIVFPDLEGGGNPRVFFPAPDGGIRNVAPVRLPAHETVYAMTIHKSQGSEFDRVHLLLPGNDAAVLTRELIYTGITRAKNKVDIWGNEGIFVTAVSRRIDRKSGLGEALWSGGK
ncbi:MAG: exodeoxyribonuclease V subunit alpha [Deltaproteobacteria bacterium]|nr:exodeoxyribonuclease V subunit alpha [Deltaproteobacteria bacterium]